MNREPTFLLKVDISGIQDFIFDTPSDGAARQLKGRSFYVYALTKIAEEYFHKLFATETLYNGGGNLLIYVTAPEEKLQQAIEKFQSSFQKESLYPFVAFTEKNEKPFEEVMNILGKEMQRKKFNRFTSFEPFSPAIAEWEDFTSKLTVSSGYVIRSDNEADGISTNSIVKAGISFIFSSGEKQFNESILNKLPRNSSGIIDFDTIAAKAEDTGTDKMAGNKRSV